MKNTLTLCRDSWSCQILPDLGMNVISLRHDGFPVLREPGSMADLHETPTLYGIPLLLPPNRTQSGTFGFKGKTYHLPINEAVHHNHLHGYLHSVPFQVLETTGCSMTARMQNDGQWFPFPFHMIITDSLQENGYHRTVRITSPDSEMPLVLAFHTTFTEPAFFSVPIGRCFLTDEHFIPTGRKAPLTPRQKACRTGFAPDGHSVNGFYEADGNTAHIGDYRFTADGFDQWILYNGDGRQGYLCVEPQLGPVNALNSGGYRILKKGETSCFQLQITCP